MARSGTRRAGSNESIRGASGQIYDDILSVAGSLIGSRKDKGADQLSALAEATRQYGDKVEIPHVSAYVSSAADQLDYLSGYMMDHDLETMIEDAGDFAKRHPVASLGLVAAAGFAITRLISMRQEQQPPTGRSASRRGTSGTRSRRKPPSRAARASGGRNSHARTAREDSAAANA